MHDALFADRGRFEGPHVWTRAERRGLEVERFEVDRRSGAVRDRVRDDFRCRLKAGGGDDADALAAGERYTCPLDLAALERPI
jgi:hypothetical protein